MNMRVMEVHDAWSARVFIYTPVALGGNIMQGGSIYYKYSTLLRGISILIEPKVGIFPEAEGQGNIHTEGAICTDISQGRVEYIYFIT